MGEAQGLRGGGYIDGFLTSSHFLKLNKPLFAVKVTAIHMPGGEQSKNIRQKHLVIKPNNFLLSNF